ncbi:MAG: c-type cytochrome biogenesis protein CcmI [Gammaproteobacteria bacterium]|nr:c-type cytochrome biogenesis protein CcmI [Gammaproteobacteria bacterium]
MVGFAVGALILLAIALTLLLRPMLRNHATDRHTRQSLNLEINREQLAEMEADLAVARADDSPLGRETVARLDAARTELARRILSDTQADVGRAHKAGETSRQLSTIIISAAVPATAIICYLVLGEPRALNPENLGAVAANAPNAITAPNLPAEMPPVDEMLAQLEARLATSPDDADGWETLGRTLNALDRTEDAKDAYQRGLVHHPSSAELLLGQAETMAKLSGNNLTGEPAMLIDKALQISPDHRKGLWLGGIAALTAGDRSRALERWKRLREAHELSQEEVQLLDRFEAMAGAEATTKQATEPAAASPAGGVDIVVQLGEGLPPKAGAQASLFVFARNPQGPKIPLAVARIEAPTFPVSVRLDDSMAMMPNMTLSSAPNIVVVARLSRSGNAIAASGDLQGESGVLTMEGRTADPVSLVIDSVVP